MEPIKPIARWSDASVGDTVRLDDGRCVLVGDVNELGGLCDDCMEQSNPVAVVTTRADFDALAAEAADARTLRAERDSLVKERDEARAMLVRHDKDGDFWHAEYAAATARADKAEALLRRVRAATRHRDQNTCDVPHALSREIDAQLAAKGQAAPTPADPTNPAPAATSGAGCTEMKEP